jgi:hypothetical protein
LDHPVDGAEAWLKTKSYAIAWHKVDTPIAMPRLARAVMKAVTSIRSSAFRN